MKSERDINPRDQKAIDYLSDTLPKILDEGAKDCNQRAQRLRENDGSDQRITEFFGRSSSILSQAAEKLASTYNEIFLNTTQLLETEGQVEEEKVSEPEKPEKLFETLIQGRIALRSIREMLNKDRFNPRDKKGARFLRSEFRELDGFLPTSAILQENSVKGFEEQLKTAQDAHRKLIEQAENIIYSLVDAKSAGLSQKTFDRMVSELAVETVRAFPHGTHQSFKEFIPAKIDDAIEAAQKNSHHD